MPSRVLQNTVAVLVVTLFTTLAVFAVVSNVEIPSTLVADTAASADSAVCPATGCTAVSCHATIGVAAASPDADSDLQTCPATGCSSYGCHATDGESTGMPGDGHGFGHGRQPATESGLEI